MEIGINLNAIGGMTEEAYVKTMAELGKACGIDVGAAAAATVTSV